MATDITEIQLKPWAEQQFERAFERREHMTERGKRVSRADFRSGYIAALIEQGVSTAFVRPGEVGL